MIVLLGSTTLARAEQRLRFDAQLAHREVPAVPRLRAISLTLQRAALANEPSRVPFVTGGSVASEADHEPAWVALGESRTRAAVTAERHLVLEVERGPVAVCLSNVLEREWRIETFEDASRAGATDHRAVMEPVPSSFTATVTLTLDY